MTVKDWFAKRKEMQIARRAQETQIDDNIGKLWVKCYSCDAQLLRKDVEENIQGLNLKDKRTYGRVVIRLYELED